MQAVPQQDAQLAMQAIICRRVAAALSVPKFVLSLVLHAPLHLPSVPAAFSAINFLVILAYSPHQLHPTVQPTQPTVVKIVHPAQSSLVVVALHAPITAADATPALWAHVWDVWLDGT